MGYSNYHVSTLISERNNLPWEAGILYLAPAEHFNLSYPFAFTKAVLLLEILSSNYTSTSAPGVVLTRDKTFPDTNTTHNSALLIAVTTGNVNTVIVRCGSICNFGILLQTDFSEAKGEDVSASLKKYFQY